MTAPGAAYSGVHQDSRYTYNKPVFSYDYFFKRFSVYDTKTD